jgi:hypothetical protein
MNDMRIKNWSKFQHFKDRRPPWVKLYRDILDDMDWHQLDPLASKVLVTLWLLASEDENQQGTLPDIKTIAWRLRLTEKQVSECIFKLSHWLEQDDINAISGGYQSDRPETETKKETKKEIEAPEGVSPEVWDSFVKQRKAKKAQITDNVMTAIQKEANKAGWSLDAALNEIVVRNWQSFKAEWVQPKQSFAQQAADVARVTVPAAIGPDPALLKIQQDRQKAAPMPSHIREQINQVLRKTA